MKTFSLVNAPHLPVTGESHPLVRESIRWLSTGNAVALGAVMLVFGALYTWSDDAVDGPVEIVAPRVFYPPPAPGPPNPNYSFAPPETPETSGVPNPVPDPVSREEIGGDDPGDIGDGTPPPGYGGGPGDGPDGGPFGGYTPATVDTFVAFDELPELLSIRAPIYPDLARRAGLDGTVSVKVLVTRAGKVKQAVAVEGPKPLHASAVDAARTALFKPALQGDNPVEVWVMIPITFSLSR